MTDLSEGRTGNSRWQKARDAELQHFTETSTLQITPRDRARDIFSHWNIGFEYFKDKEVLAVGGGTGLVHLLSESKQAVSLDPLNDSIYPSIRAGVQNARMKIPQPKQSTFSTLNLRMIKFIRK